MTDINAAQELKRIIDESGQLEITRLQKAIELRRQEARIKLDSDQRQLEKDIGSGAFSQRFQQQKIENLQIQRGREIIQELREAAGKGVGLDETLTAMLREANRLSAQSGQDFSGIASLSGLQFEGLRALDGLSISIK